MNLFFWFFFQFGHWQPWELNPSSQFLILLSWTKLLLPMALLEVSSLTTFGMKKRPFLTRWAWAQIFSFALCYNLSYLCRALCVVWTTPLVATLGMSLTIPLAMMADMMIHGRHYSAIYILGSLQVMKMHMTLIFVDFVVKISICCILVNPFFGRPLVFFYHILGELGGKCICWVVGHLQATVER